MPDAQQGESGVTEEENEKMTPNDAAAERAAEDFRDVFVSYASQDSAIAKALCESLERHGVQCWISPRDVTPGALYADQILRAINGTKILVLVLSQSAIASAHVGKEIERASSKRRPIIALRTDTAPLTPALEYFLSESQWVDLTTGGPEAAFGKLVEAVRRHLAQTSDITPVAPPGAYKPQHFSPASRRTLLLVAAITTVVAALAYGLAERFRLSKHATQQALATVPNAVSDKSIAVLPFADMSERRDQEYFADGIAEEVLDRLAKVPGLKVVGRASSFQFKGKSTDPAGIGATLGVSYLLEGSVRRDGDHVRVGAQLVEARSGSQIWSDAFDSEVIDVLRVQDTIAAELARALQIAVEVDATPRSAVKSPQVLEAYLRGLQSYASHTEVGCEAAVAEFQRALALDPTFAPAAIGLAKVYIYIGSLAWLPTPAAFEHAREAALLAQRLDPKSPTPHIFLAEIHKHYDWDWVGADRELQLALALGPRDSYGAQTASSLAAALGQWSEARQLAVEAITLDPLDPEVQGNPGFEIYLRTGDLGEAEQSFRRALQIAPAWGSGHYFLGVALMLQGHHAAALAEFQKETQEDGQAEGAAMIYFLTGRKAESDEQLAQAIRRSALSWPSEIARVYAFRGDRDHAFEWLDRAYEARDEDLYFIKADPLLKNLEGDVRYKTFLHKMNLPE
jgi:TolB-like protein/Flp pilus assembly protein TadD